MGTMPGPAALGIACGSGAGAEDTAKLCSFRGGDDTMLRPWHHYRVFVSVQQPPLDPDDPCILFPEPEVELGKR
jgi:hypothetical protein